MQSLGLNLADREVRLIETTIQYTQANFDWCKVAHVTHNQKGVSMISPDRRPVFFQAYQHAAVIVAGVEPNQLTHPTPCHEYDVAALIDHLVGVAETAAVLGRGETPPSGDDFSHVELSDAPQLLAQAAKNTRDAWANDFTLTAPITMPWGETYPGSTVIDMYLAELATHTWDLAKATKQLDKLDSDLAITALEAARSMLKPEFRNLVKDGSPFGGEIPAPDNATSWERLAAFMGRQPRLK